jgi:hypothetical protein
MPWDEVQPREAEATREGARSAGAEEQVPVAH